MVDQVNIATDLTIKGIYRAIRNCFTSKKEMEDFRDSIKTNVSEQLKEHNETIVKSLAQENADNAKKAAASEANAAASESNAKISEENSLMSEASSRDQAKLAKKWADAEESPDDEFDKDSRDGKTHSSKSWAKVAKEEAVTATGEVKKISGFAQEVKDALKKAQELQSAAQELRDDVDKIIAHADDMMVEFRGIRDSLSDAVLYKGSVETYADLPTDALIGWMYNVQVGEPAFNVKAGDNFIWNGKDWDNMGGFLNVDEILKKDKDASFGDLKAKTIQADTVTSKLNGTASRAVIAESAESIDWSKIKNKPVSMPADGGTADRALKADACTGNAASASAVAWDNITGKPSTFTPSSHNHDSVYPSTTGTRASGTWEIDITGNAGTASHINNSHPRLANALESNEIAIRDNANGAWEGTLPSIRKSLDFDWYNTRWSIGNIRGFSTDTVGFGFGYKADKTEGYTAKAWIDTDGTYHGNVSCNNLRIQNMESVAVQSWDTSTGTLKLVIP